MGPSGSGKTTLLNTLAGVVPYNKVSHHTTPHHNHVFYHHHKTLMFTCTHVHSALWEAPTHAWQARLTSPPNPQPRPRHCVPQTSPALNPAFLSSTTSTSRPTAHLVRQTPVLPIGQTLVSPAGQTLVSSAGQTGLVLTASSALNSNPGPTPTPTTHCPCRASSCVAP